MPTPNPTPGAYEYVIRGPVGVATPNEIHVQAWPNGRDRRRHPEGLVLSMKSLRRREAGLTLVEMLIAVALLGIILLGIAPLFIASVQVELRRQRVHEHPQPGP